MYVPSNKAFLTPTTVIWLLTLFFFLSFPKRHKKDRFRALKSQIVELEEEINTLKFRLEEVEEDFNALKRLLWFDIETVIFRYEHIAWQIFDELNDKNLGNCRLVCKSWKECIDNGKSFWICLHQRFKNLPILERKHIGPALYN